MSALYDEADFAIAKDDDEAKEFITGWMPIETAPRDGRMAIVYRPLARESNDEPVALKRLVEYDNHCWPCTVPKGQKPFNPTDGACHVTHWMPLPTAPTA